MSDPSAVALVESYLDEVAAGLYGLRRQRRRILAELRDGFSEAIGDRLVDGLPPGRAAAAVIASFGDPRQVAAAFAGELATGCARRTVAGYVATGPLVGIWWLLLLHPEPWRTGPAALIAAIPVLPMVALGVAIAAGVIATTGRLIRWLPEAPPRRALAAAVGVAALAALADLFMIVFYARHGFHGEPLAVIAVTAGLVRIGCGVHVIRRWYRWAGRTVSSPG